MSRFTVSQLPSKMKGSKRDNATGQGISLPPAEEIVAAALNEQGYLFQQKLVSTLLSHQLSEKCKHRWQLEATELPVSIANGEETRIDVVLRLGPESKVPVHAVIECKRLARSYKRWVFFAQNEVIRNPLPQNYYIERTSLAESYRGSGEPVIHHQVNPKHATDQCPVFDYGIEAKLQHGGGDKKVSATEAIESALQQVTLGQAGLGAQLRKAHIFNFRVLPVVATTAELMSAHFDPRHVSLDRGTIDAKKVKLIPRKWLATNFRIREAISSAVPMGLHNKLSLAANLTLRQVRTVFVVQAEHIQDFLAWLESSFPSASS